ncbi:hypothetical protein [Streptomyces sp. NPDC016675]|uniref:hypothetical protein n=1 Tax=Streptomyces sp. NPDC016675 TaxID=3364970 RepID=UPI0036FE30AB
MVLGLGDSLARVDPRAGVSSGEPVPLERGPSERGPFAPTGRLAARPDHPHQVAVVTGTWRDSGRIEVGDVRRGTREARLERGP